jgi:hypothetical protein
VLSFPRWTYTERQGFSKYAAALKARLRAYGFTQKFQLDADADRQHKFTTWIEFLGYEYWWYDHFATWKKKKKSGTRKPG